MTSSLLLSHLSVVQIEPRARLGRCSVRVDSDNEGLFAGCKKMITFFYGLSLQLTDQSSSGGLSLYSEDSSTHVGLVGLHSQRDRDSGDPVHAQVGDGHKAGGAECGGGGSSSCCRGGGAKDPEGVWRGGGGLLPHDTTVSLLSPDAVCVVLSLQKLTVAVAVDGPRDPSEELSTVCRGPGHTQ